MEVFKKGDLVCGNSRYYIEGNENFGKNLKQIKKTIVLEVYDNTDLKIDNPIHYLLKVGNEERSVNHIFLEQVA